MSGFYARDAPARFPRSYSIRGATTAHHVGEPTTENIVSFPIREPQREPGGGGDLGGRSPTILEAKTRCASRYWKLCFLVKLPCLGKNLLPNRINRERGEGGEGVSAPNRIELFTRHESLLVQKYLKKIIIFK